MKTRCSHTIDRKYRLVKQEGLGSATIKTSAYPKQQEEEETSTNRRFKNVKSIAETQLSSPVEVINPLKIAEWATQSMEPIPITKNHRLRTVSSKHSNSV